MYVPAHFEIPVDRLDALLAQVHAGNLVTTHADGPKATFVPFHLERRGEQKVLVTHLVRNNPQAREPVTGPALAILDIDDAYISPPWYASNEALPNVPTWDYITIHLTGPVRLTTTPEEALAAARALTSHMEAPEVLEAVGEAKLLKMARAIVGVELTVEKVEAKAKASQNRHPDDLRSLLPHLEADGQTDLSRYIREVSLPHAEERFGTIESLRSGRILPTSPAD